jgi:hypothetical protein
VRSSSRPCAPLVRPGPSSDAFARTVPRWVRLCWQSLSTKRSFGSPSPGVPTSQEQVGPVARRHDCRSARLRSGPRCEAVPRGNCEVRPRGTADAPGTAYPQGPRQGARPLRSPSKCLGGPTASPNGRTDHMLGDRPTFQNVWISRQRERVTLRTRVPEPPIGVVEARSTESGFERNSRQV